MNRSGEEVLVSVILPVFNENLLHLNECIQSVLNQSYNNIEILVIDDSTNSKVVNYLMETARRDRRVVHVHNPERIGFVRSLNKGLFLAKGDYIARVDARTIIPSSLLSCFLEKALKVNRRRNYCAINELPRK